MADYGVEFSGIELAQLRGGRLLNDHGDGDPAWASHQERFKPPGKGHGKGAGKGAGGVQGDRHGRAPVSRHVSYEAASEPCCNPARCLVLFAGLLIVLGWLGWTALFDRDANEQLQAAGGGGFLGVGQGATGPGGPGPASANAGELNVYAATFDVDNQPLKDYSWLADGNLPDTADLVLWGFQEIEEEPPSILAPFTGQKGAGWKNFEQRFKPALNCKRGMKGHTMHAFVHPKSRWTIEQIEFAFEDKSNSVNCKSNNGNHGCSVYNHVTDCYAALSLMVFQATSKVDQTVQKTVCALNARLAENAWLSTKQKRLNDIMHLVKGAKCDVFVAVGNFESRLRCDSGDKLPLPMIEGKVKDDKNALNDILDTFCSEGDCKLQGDHQDADELTQLLTKEKLSCFDHSSLRIRHPWKLEETKNTFINEGLKEVEVPAFMPTWQLGSQIDFTDGEKRRCLKGHSTCFGTKTKDHNDNPAWLDRILMYTEQDVKVKVDEYRRLDVPNGVSQPPGAKQKKAARHAAVIARLTFTLSTPQTAPGGR